MTRIGLLSDTHGNLDPAAIPFLLDCDEIWHAGDIGTKEVLDQLGNTGKTLRLVHGNIDGPEIRYEAPARLVWEVERRRILMIHIGGYPGRYAPGVQALIAQEAPDIFVCGHSHILKVQYDEKNHLLALNPGACGRSGFHLVRTMLLFTIDDRDIRDMRVVELGARAEPSRESSPDRL